MDWSLRGHAHIESLPALEPANWHRLEQPFMLIGGRFCAFDWTFQGEEMFIIIPKMVQLV